MSTQTIKICPPDPNRSSHKNPLPAMIQTPSGLAIIELQGIIAYTDGLQAAFHNGQINNLPIGNITFPNYNPEFQEEGSTAWMKKVYMFVGGHQRLAGEVKKLPQPIAVIHKKPNSNPEELQIMEIVQYKIVFNSRPEPVSFSP